MYEPYVIRILKRLKLTKNYVFFSLLYGLSTLLIPFAVQLMVNNLALTGLWVSTFSFLVLIAIGLILTLLVKYAQFLLIEYMQRQILNHELKSWFDETNEEEFHSPYYFEMFKLLKSFSSICSEGVDFSLTTAFGILALTFIHPAFLLISLLFITSLIIVRYLGKGAVDSSIEESNRKYELFERLNHKKFDEFRDMSLGYFQARNHHFSFIKRQAITLFTTYFILQMILLGWGIHLIQINELSIGQLVSAEIISSNIFMNLVKLPKLLEGFYDFETSYYKLEHAKGSA